MRILYPTLAILLFLTTQADAAATTKQPTHSPAVPAIVLDLELTGDTSISLVAATDAVLLKKFSQVIRDKLQDSGLYTVIQDKETQDDLLRVGKAQYLHRCNGCELKLAARHGAEQVVVPTIFRMSVLIQTLLVEVRDVQSGDVVIRKAYNFRSNTELAWQKTTDYFIRDLLRMKNGE